MAGRLAPHAIVSCYACGREKERLQQRMQRLPKIILLSGLILIVFVNLLMGFVPFYKGAAHPIRADMVSVSPGLKSAEVYLANEYDYRIWRLSAVMNFYLVGGTILLWLAAEWWARLRGEARGKLL